VAGSVMGGIGSVVGRVGSAYGPAARPHEGVAYTFAANRPEKMPGILELNRLEVW